MYLTYHSSGQYILHPWGHDFAGDPFNKEKHRHMGNVAAQAIKNVNGRSYTIGGAAKLLTPGAGMSIQLTHAYTTSTCV